MSRIELKLSVGLCYVRMGIVQGKYDVALDLLNDLIKQVEAAEEPGGPLGPKEEPHEDDERQA